MDYLRFIEDGLGIAIDQGLERSFDALPDRSIEEFREKYFAVPRDGTHEFVRKRSNEHTFFRPLIDENFLSYGGGYFQFERQIRLDVLTDLVYSLSIFCDSLVLRDPLYLLLVWFTGPDMREIEKRRNNLRSFLCWLRAIRPFYDADVIDFYSIGPAQKIRYAPRSSNLSRDYLHSGDVDPDDTSAITVSKYLSAIDEMYGVSKQVDADVFLDTSHSVEAFEYWMTNSDRGLTRATISPSEAISRALHIDFPIYSVGLEKDFMSFVRDDDAAARLRECLDNIVREIVNLEEISKGAATRTALRLANERIAELENQLSRFGGFAKLKKGRIDAFRIFGTPMSAAINNAERADEINRELRAVGFIRKGLTNSQSIFNQALD